MSMDIFEGRITSCGFISGDRLVIGYWKDSPFGSFSDIMWATSDGKKILIAPNQEIGDYISSMYEFDIVKIEEIKVEEDINQIKIDTKDISCHFEWGNGISFLTKKRPLWFVSSVEYLFGWLIFGTKTHGKTKNGKKEWYAVDRLSKLISAKAYINGDDLGEYTSFYPKANFGFSDPPKMPSSVLVRSHIE
jgi:hypothetical protein